MKIPIITLIVLIFGIAFAIACEEEQPLGNAEFAEADTTLVGPTWQLVAFVEDDGDQILVESLPERGRGYTVVFTKRPAEECIHDETPPFGIWCMEVVGHPNSSPSTTYDLAPGDQSLTIYFRGQTQVLPPSGAKEQEFFDALGAAKSYRINSKQLRIFYGNGNTLLFELKKQLEE